MTYIGPSLPPPYAPVEVTDLEIAFPAHALRLMPKMEDIEPAPEWEELANDWFVNGLNDLNLLPSKALAYDLDSSPEVAWRHLRAIIGSFEPSHQHKIAALGFLLSRWFRWAEWVTTKNVHKEIGTKTIK